MAGFDKIKRKLEKFNKGTEQYEIVFEDKLPHSVPYEKCYEDDEIVNYNYQHFLKLTKNLKIKKPGYYQFSVDTLGAYIDARVVYEIATEVTCKAVESNLDPEYGPSLKEEPAVMFTRKEF